MLFRFSSKLRLHCLKSWLIVITLGIALKLQEFIFQSFTLSQFGVFPIEKARYLLASSQCTF